MAKAKESGLYDENGQFVGDPTPIEVPVGFKRPPTIHEQIKMFIRREMSQTAAQQGLETFDEMNDFGNDEDDDILPTSPHEFSEAQEEYLKEALRHGETERAEHEARTRGSAEKAAGEQAKASGVGGTGEEGKKPRSAGPESVKDDRRRASGTDEVKE